MVHWVGSDITALARDQGLAARLEAARVVHLAEVDWTAKQLKAHGLSAVIAPLPPRHIAASVHPLHERFTVMLYLPHTRGDFYGKRNFERLMQRLSALPIRYFIVGGGTLAVPIGVEAHSFGWRAEMDELYEQTTVLIRNTPRDGLSLMVLEALSFGRYVIWSQNFDGVLHATTYADIESHILNLYRRHIDGELAPQIAVMQRIREQYDPMSSFRSIVQQWENAADRRGKRDGAGTHNNQETSAVRLVGDEVSWRSDR